MDGEKNKEDCYGHANIQESNFLLNVEMTDGTKSENESANNSVKHTNSRQHDEAIPLTKFQIWKNILVISVGFFCLFAAFNSISNLQSTLNKDDGIGTTALAMIYASFVISFVVVANPVISKFGCKWSMFMAMICYLFYMAANMYPVWGLMIPSSFLVGLGAGPLWGGFSVYFTQISRWLSQITNQKEQNVLMFTFGIFYMIVNTCNIAGNLMSSVILNDQTANKSQPSQTEIEECLGNENIAVSNITTLERPDQIKVYTLCGVWIGLGVLGVICIFMIDNIKLGVTNKNQKMTKVLMTTIQHLRRSRTQKIILPLSLYYGMLQAFVAADFLRSFVACALGIDIIGYVMVCNACMAALTSLVAGHCGKYIGTIPIFTIAFLVGIGLQTTLLIWRPNVDSAPVLFTIAGLFGVVTTILKSQLTALYGFIFRDNVDAAFGNNYSVEGLGYVVAFSYSSYISTQYKLYVLQCVAVISTVAYYTVEYIQRHKNTNETKRQNDIYDDISEECDK